MKKPNITRIMGHKTVPAVMDYIKRGVGRPITTGSSTVHIAFRMSAAERAELTARGNAVGLSAAQMAQVYVRKGLRG